MKVLREDGRYVVEPETSDEDRSLAVMLGASVSLSPADFRQATGLRASDRNPRKASASG